MTRLASSGHRSRSYTYFALHQFSPMGFAHFSINRRTRSRWTSYSASVIGGEAHGRFPPLRALTRLGNRAYFHGLGTCRKSRESHVWLGHSPLASLGGSASTTTRAVDGTSARSEWALADGTDVVVPSAVLREGLAGAVRGAGDGVGRGL